jgi:hypothetical protein
MERLDQIEPWRAATDRQLYYWVGVDSGRAISFAKKFRSALPAPASVT